MLFNSTSFLIFFLGVFSAYWLLPAGRARVWLLLAASYYFYMSWNARLAGVVAGSSLADYFIALGMERHPGQKKPLLTASIVMNLGLLFYFKYANFFLDSLRQLLAGIGIPQQMPVLNVILPIGISFYTFEAISYTVDVYNGRVKAERNAINFLLFITFFPRMIAGPIIRARNFLPQLHLRRRFSWPRFDLGLQYVLMGLFKKMAIADRMACLVDPVYQSPERYSTSAVWVAVVAYSLQIYGDFSGYSDIAIGTAHMLGFKLPVNFNMPYFSRNIAEFWRRWHISLSSWLRDYVFQRILGSRRSNAKMSMSLMFTMTLCGLWHGARWTFIISGIGQGIMLLVHHNFRVFCKPRPAIRQFLDKGTGEAMRVALTYFSIVIFTFVLFRAPDFRTAAEIFRRLCIPSNGVMVRSPVGPWSLAVVFALLLICHLMVERGLWKKTASRMSPPVWGGAYTALFVLACLLTPSGEKAFIYFQF